MGLFTLILILNIDGQYTSTALQRDLDVTTCKREMNFLMKDKIQGRIFLPYLFLKTKQTLNKVCSLNLKIHRGTKHLFMCVCLKA